MRILLRSFGEEDFQRFASDDGRRHGYMYGISSQQVS